MKQRICVVLVAFVLIFGMLATTYAHPGRPGTPPTTTPTRAVICIYCQDDYCNVCGAITQLLGVDYETSQ